MKQITIYEFLKINKDIIKGRYLTCDKDGEWCQHMTKPHIGKYEYDEDPKDIREWWTSKTAFPISIFFNIAPFDGDWKDSLIKVEHKEEE